MIETVILDWSGVVSDDLEAVWLTSNDILEERKVRRISFDEFRNLFELPFMNFYKKLGIEIDEKEERKMWDRIFPKYYGKLKIFPNAKKAIETLKQENRKIIVLSAHNEKLLLNELKTYGLLGLIDDVHASINDKREEISKLAARHKINPSKTIYVGDMEHDVETAKRAGIKSVVVLCGYDTKETLERKEPDYIINDLGELPELVGKLDGDSK